MPEWPEKHFARTVGGDEVWEATAERAEEFRNEKRPVAISTPEVETYVPRQKLEEVEREREKLRELVEIEARVGDGHRKALDALEGEEAVEAIAEALWNEREFRDPSGDVYPDDWYPPGDNPDAQPPREPFLWEQMVAEGKWEGEQAEYRADALKAAEAALQAAKNQAGESGTNEKEVEVETTASSDPCSKSSDNRSTSPGSAPAATGPSPSHSEHPSSSPRPSTSSPSGSAASTSTPSEIEEQAGGGGE